jgi:GLPGLI family protein
MKIRSAFATLLGLSMLLIASCGPDDEHNISEGVIEYDATVVDQANPMANLAPSKMTMRFKENKAVAEMSAGMGLFSTSFISDPDKKTLTQLVKLLNKKFSLVQNQAEIEAENKNYPVEVTPTKETKMIAGYKCLKSHVKMKDDSGVEFDIFYTKDLGIKDPNFCNPFYMVDGVLMEYQMKKFDLEMRFTAKSVKKEDVDDSAFDLPSDYKKISQKEMNELFQGLQ